MSFLLYQLSENRKKIKQDTQELKKQQDIQDNLS